MLLRGSYGKLPDEEKAEFCENLDCDETIDQKVCGVKFGEDFSYRVFDNECQLLKHGCQVDEDDGKINYSLVIFLLLFLILPVVEKA